MMAQRRGGLAGKHAVVTGAARGLGFAIARRFLEEGAAVTIWDLPNGRGEAAATSLAPLGAVDFVAFDQADPDAADAAMAATVAAHGRIDTLVNNAGISGFAAPLWEYPKDTWREVMDINLSGVFYVCRAVIPHMLQQGGGKIVNIASIAGKEGNPGMSAYSAAKGGVIALTKALGKELATRNILVNAIAPTVIRTDMMQDFSAEATAAMLAKIPMGRFGEPEEVAAMAYWLASDEMTYATGAVFDLSGGRAVY